jgi:O-antigen ligase
VPHIDAGTRAGRPRSTTAAMLPKAILFIGGLNLAMPAYSWATPVQVVHGIFIDDLLLISYLMLAGASGRFSSIRTGNTVFLLLILCLASLGVISAGISGYALADFGEAMRLFLFAAYFVVAVGWARTRGHTFLLRYYLLGIATGGAINIFYSVAEPYLVINSLPVLRARNGAGGLLALGVCLGAWLWFVRQTRSDTVVAILMAAVGLCAVAISFSKTSISIGACGVIAWVCVAGSALTMRTSRRIAMSVVSLLLVAGIVTARSPEASERMALVVRSAQTKFVNLDLNNPYSLGTRYMYFWAVLEIVTEHPLFGVSYSGFYDALKTTTPYQSGLMIEEDAQVAAAGIPNPHNSFLYYASANGLPGLILVVALFVSFLRALWRSHKGRGLGGTGVAACLGFGYVIYAMTLPSLFSTEVFYVPAACAICFVSIERSARARQTTLHSVQREPVRA